jgi:hypothetical protein
MAKIVFGMNQSLDGYVDHREFSPNPALFRHFIEQARGLAGSVYGRRRQDCREADIRWKRVFSPSNFQPDEYELSTGR